MIETETRRAPDARQAKTDPHRATMRAAAIARFGGPEVLTIHTLPLPALDPLEVLIALDTSGVGVWDAEMRAGWVPGGRPGFPWCWGPTERGQWRLWARASGGSRSAISSIRTVLTFGKAGSTPSM